MYLPLFVLFLPDGARHLKRVEGVFYWGGRNAKWWYLLCGVGWAKAQKLEVLFWRMLGPGSILLSEASFAPRAGCVTGCAVICVWFKFTQLSIDSTNTNPA